MTKISKVYQEFDFIVWVDDLFIQARYDLVQYVFMAVSQEATNTFFDNLGIQNQSIRVILYKKLNTLCRFDEGSFLEITKAYFPEHMMHRGSVSRSIQAKCNPKLGDDGILYVLANDCSLKYEYLQVVQNLWPFLDVRIIANRNSVSNRQTKFRLNSSWRENHRGANMPNERKDNVSF